MKQLFVTLTCSASLQSQVYGFCFVVGLFLSAGAGCSDGRPERVPVSGTVLIDGKPLSHGTVQFVPVGARPSMSRLDSEGRFSLSSYKLNDGVTIGTHKVQVDGSESIGEETRKWHAPPHYASTKTSGLQVEIDGPEDDLKIELSWNGKEPFVEKGF
jgi:hypothetical protein